MMKKTADIAYIYLCHNNPELLGRVSKTLEYGRDAIFVHVDKKVDIEPFIESTKDCSNVHFLTSRIKNYWGGFNSVISTVETMRMALKSGSYSRFVILQGQDYPLFSPKEIHDYFDNNDVEYCKAKDITVSPDKTDYMKWAGYWFMDIEANKLIPKAVKIALGKINKLGIKYRSGIFKYKKEKWHMYSGWAHFALTRSCVEHIIDVFDNNRKFNNFMKHRFPPDEMFFHTIIHNSRFKSKVSNDTIVRRNGEKTNLNLTYCEYPVQVTVFTEKSDYEWLKNTGCLFVRKVNSSSTELLDEIDRNIKMQN